ncbi:MAG: pyrroline-5-carboxylate reductase [Deltaproteobacteria bacterium]|nr:pyrroline-5-carboxylate reductase [Deltaproteobacteria bacterium]
MTAAFAFIGAGNMGAAMARAVLQSQAAPPDGLLLVDPDEAKTAPFRAMGCLTAQTPGKELSGAGLVVLAVKPQSAPQVLPGLAPWLTPPTVVVSIMAGVRLESLQGWLGHRRVARAMPNTPAQVGSGMSVYFPDESIGGEGLARVEQLLTACGQVLRVNVETAIDAATAVSGSGPAYLFYLAEHWMKAAVNLGFSPVEAEQLVSQTLLGAVRLWQADGRPVEALRQSVTSKGGTTAAALAWFESQHLGEGLQEGIQKAFERAGELAG